MQNVCSGFLRHRMMTKVFGAKKEEVTGDWREMHKEELNVFSSPAVRVVTPRKM